MSLMIASPNEHCSTINEFAYSCFIAKQNRAWEANACGTRHWTWLRGNIPCAQAWELPQNNPWNAEHLFRAAKFSNVRSLTLLIDTNHGADTTRVNYLAFKGVFTPLKSEPIVAQYELRPVPGAAIPPHSTRSGHTAGALPFLRHRRRKCWDWVAGDAARAGDLRGKLEQSSMNNVGF